MERKKAHLWALICIVVWGSSFVTTSVLLETFTPSTLVFFRFLIGYATVLVMDHRVLKMNVRDEIGMAAFGLIGVTMYYLFESWALKYTYAANVSILVTFAPVLTMVLSCVLYRDEKIHSRFVIGSIVALIGVVLVIFNGRAVLQLNPLGDLLALGAAFCWASYSLFLKYYTAKYDEILITRRVLFYACLTLLPLAAADGSSLQKEMFLQIRNGGLLLFLGALSSGICYIGWTYANVHIGIVAANVYVYVSPFVTLASAAIFLGEPVTLMSVIGCVLIIVGVVFSQRQKSTAE